MSAPAPVQKVVINSSYIGAGATVYIVTVLVIWSYPDAGILGLSVLSVFVGAASILKSLLALPRPHFVSSEVVVLDPTKEMSYGFPSGHAVVVTGVYGSMAIHLVAGEGDSGPWPSIVMWVVGVMAAATMLSRVASGAHFPADVVGGAAIGMAGYVASTAGMGGSDGETMPYWTKSTSVFLGMALATFFTSVRCRTPDGLVRYPLVSEGMYSSAICASLWLMNYHRDVLATLDLSASTPSSCSLKHQAIGLLGLAAFKPLEKALIQSDKDGNRTLVYSLVGMSLTILLQFYSVLFVPNILPRIF